jgi:restriction endonuclease S subunit
MKDLDQQLAEMIEQEQGKEEVNLPSIDEQKAIVAELKRLEANGELTPEILEAHFGQFYATTNAPIH